MKLVRRLLTMSPAEVRERASQALAVRIDRAGLGPRVRDPDPPTFLRGLRDPPPGGWSAEALLDRFRGRAGRFFAGVEALDGTVAALRRLDPSDEGRIVRAADAIRAGRISVFGHEYAVGALPDWSLEPETGIRYPQHHWSRIDYLRPDVGGEYKVAWEISRHQYFFDLGAAWAYTGDEGYAVTLLSHLASWIERNPPGRGIHWASSLEVAFRAVSWIWSLHLLRDAPVLEPERFADAVGSLDAHGRHIERYLSTYFSPNTHLTGEALALFWIAVSFPELPCSARWRRTGWDVLEAQLPRQVRPDGSYFEQSTAYARYTADFYLHLMILARRLDLDVPDAMVTRLECALEAILAVTRPDGTTPYLGDDDGGRLFPTDGRDPRDLRAPLATAALLFGRTDFKEVAGPLSTESVWLMGPGAIDDYAALRSKAPSSRLVALRDGGIYVQRSGWRRDADMLVVGCGPHGMLNCGHAHADLLSVDVSIGGRTVLVDSGTFTYTSDPALRNHFRSGSAHNGLTIDASGSSIPSGPFQWALRTDGELLAWLTGPDWCWFAGRERFPGGVVHDRGILFLRDRGWIVIDGVSGGLESALVELSFHAAPDLDAREASAGRVELVDRVSGEAVAALAWQPGDHEHRVEDTVHSPWYRQLQDSRVVRLGGHVALPFGVVTAIGAPGRTGPLIEGLVEGGEPAPGASTDSGTDGLARDTRRPAGPWPGLVWVARAPDGSPERVLLINRARLILDGHVWLDSPGRLRALDLHRAEAGWTVRGDLGTVVADSVQVQPPDGGAVRWDVEQRSD